MSAPRVVAVAPGSPAERAGVCVGDLITAVCGEPPRDVIRYQLLTDGADPTLDIDRGGLELAVEVAKADGEPLGIEVDTPVFDRVRTCDNHCSFCFIHQLPPGMRRSLYLKDDDYRLSFLYGNFTTLTRFTEADLERVVTERLSPLYVSIHATDPELRSAMLRNRRGATSLRWLRALLDHGVEVHGQIVVCPGQNDGVALERTLCDVADRYSELATLCVVPLGVSRHSTEAELRPHTRDEAAAVVDTVERWQDTFSSIVGHRLVYAADEYYVLAGREFPPAAVYGEFPMHEDGIGMARCFEQEFGGRSDGVTGPKAGFFSWVDGAPAAGYRAPRTTGCGVVSAGEAINETGAGSSGSSGMATAVALRPRRSAPVAILTAPLGAAVLAPLVAGLERDDVRILTVANRFFGGNIGVTGLMVGEDVAAALRDAPEGHRYLLPDVCLSGGRFLDGTTPEELPRPVEVLPTDGAALRAALHIDTPQPGAGRTGAAQPVLEQR